MRYWTPEEDATLEARYRRAPAKILAAELGRSVWSVRHRAILLKIKGGRYWTPEEDAKLRAGWGKVRTRILAAELCRTPSALKQRAIKLGLDAERYYTEEDLRLIRDLYHTHTAAEIARRLHGSGRSAPASSASRRTPREPARAAAGSATSTFCRPKPSPFSKGNSMNNSLRLDDARERTPAPTGVGAWMQKLRQAAFDAVREEDMTDLMKSLMKRAKEGDNNAAKLVLSYLTGNAAPPPPPGLTAGQVRELVRAGVDELRQVMADEVEKRRLPEGRGPAIGVRQNGDRFELVGKLSDHATEQEAEAEARRLAENGNRGH